MSPFASVLMSGGLSSWFGALGYLLLVFTPGAWITSGLELGGIPFWARLLTGATLSPLIVSIEFFAVRLIGIPFGPATVVLLALNLPVLYLIWKRRPQVESLGHGDWLIGAIAVAISVICMMSLLITPNARIYSAHAWIYADPVYMFARGYLVPEDPTLAGIKLTYPVWSGLVFEGVHSFLVNSPPMSCYVWSNLVWLVLNYGLAAGIAKEMGGGKLAQLSSGIWLFIGTNPVGYILMRLAPAGMSHQLWGDARYTPWVSKFQLFSTMELGLGMMLAMIYLLVRSGPLTKQLLVTIFLLLTGIGLFYPLLFPAAGGLIGAKGLALLAEKHNDRWTFPYREWLALAGLLLVAALATYGQLKFLGSDKPVTHSLVLLSTTASAARKVLESVIASSLLLAGLAFTLRRCWKSRRSATAFLLGGALASYFLHAAFHILAYDNEYKFIFVVAMCLAVFPALAVEQVWREWPRAKASPVLAAAALLLFTTYAHWSYVYWPAPGMRNPGQSTTLHLAPIPGLDTSQFYPQLDQGQPWSAVCNAVRQMTPGNSVLVLDNGEFYYPGLTSRSLYVSRVDWAYAGVNLDADYLDSVMRGNGRQILDQRRATLTDFFDAKDPTRREEALNVILGLKRPVAIIAEPQHGDLLEWLKQRGTAVELYAENGLSLWLIDRHGKEANGSDR
ncbi:MAG TPA: hypothetical protein VKM93_09750 [Terriglobia bacterium]|nr:hypothetical protein [Terriglobia bacterium]